MGQNWYHVDATTGNLCGSDYLPISASDLGEMSFVYASRVKIDITAR